MIKIFLFFFGTLTAVGQTYPPAAGSPGSTAISANSNLISSWATGIGVERGFVDAGNPNYVVAGSNFATAGSPDMALGPVNGQSVSLGDGGRATLTFASPVVDGAGFDFVVFETGTNGYLELAFVEVSSNGIDFFRFPNHSQTPTHTQLGTFESPLPEYLHNLAGKYNGTFGTPFDLSEVPNHPNLDKNAITHVRIIDVVGAIRSDLARYDSFGNAINDSFPTPFAAAGFDLQGVGVIHSRNLSVAKNSLTTILLYPNPVRDYLYLHSPEALGVEVADLSGRIIQSYRNIIQCDLSALPTGFYLVTVSDGFQRNTFKINKE